MAKLFIFGIGGTGSRVIKSLIMLLAAGMKSQDDFEIVPIIIDPHKDNEDLKRTVSILNNYQKIIGKAGLKNGFFGTKVTTLQALNSGDNLGGGYAFKLNDVAQNKFKDYFSYNSLGEENQAMADLLFSGKSINSYGDKIDLLEMPMDIGFVGNPNVGSVVLNQFKDSEEFKDFANNFNEGDRIFIISSIFGGTGAAGFPIILKNIRNAINLPGLTSGGFLQNSSIGALTVMPYFNIEADENSPIKKSNFIEKTKAALGYYSQNVNPSLNAMYYIGDDFIGKPYKNDPGNDGQKNNAHFVELAGALAIIDFMNTPASYLANTGGVPLSPIYKEYGVKLDSQVLNFTHLSDVSNANLGKSLTQFTLFKKYLDEQLENSIELRVWSTDPPKIDKLFKNNVFFSSNLKGFLKDYTDWLNELSINSRSFSPFNLSTDLTMLVNDKPIAKAWYGKAKFDYDKYDAELGKEVRKEKYASAEEKIIKLFFSATKRVAEDKYGF